MFSYPGADEVLDDLGDKVVEAFARSVARARADLAEYRRLKPSWVAQSSERGLANWIHDRLWYHLTVLLDGIPAVQLVDSEPTREIFVGFRYRLRAKRHGDDGTVSTYPTPGAVEFLFQPPAQEALSGLEEIRLIVGYTWDRETRTMGQAVLSLRDGQDEIVWLVDLPDPGTGYAGGTVIPLLPPADGPSSPVIQLGDEETDRDHKDMEEGTRS